MHRRRHVAGNELGSIDVVHFNDVLHEINPDAPHLDADAIASAARWLASLPGGQAEATLRARLGRIDELHRLLCDLDWQVDAAMHQRIGRLLDYVDDDGGMIPDRLPFVGQLDDALLVELAWPALADEVEDFRDFCRFRDESGHLYGGHPTRDDWLRTRLEEGALWEQLHRVRDRRYSEYGPPREGLHVV
ncbi:MAG TPA: hypothetical protein VFY12_02390 [Arenimonas sp.]|nr:hypothetical protein [Arenimonas sp.]